MARKVTTAATEATSAAEGYVDVELSRPIEIDGAQVTVLRMREPTVADQLLFDELKGGNAAKEVAVVANLCEVTPDDIKRLPLKDFMRLQKAFAGFIDLELTT